jgi:hypothetical protein
VDVVGGTVVAGTVVAGAVVDGAVAGVVVGAAAVEDVVGADVAVVAGAMVDEVVVGADEVEGAVEVEVGGRPIPPGGRGRPPPPMQAVVPTASVAASSRPSDGRVERTRGMGGRASFTGISWMQVCPGGSG